MRAMATIREIDSIRPIPDADAIECAVVGGWTVVVKKGEFRPGDVAIYCEIDSFIPSAIAPFLTKPGQYSKVFNGVEGERLRTVKLRGQLSQGLLLPFEASLAIKMGAGPGALFTDYVGRDVSEHLGIQKWEAPIPACLSGQVRGAFPSAVPKTDQERIQNLSNELEDWKARKLTFEVTEKLDGSSCTMYLDLDGEFHVCSRNLDLKDDDANSFWKVAKEYDVAGKMEEMGYRGFAIQGELIGEGVQGNLYGIKGQDFRVYDVYYVKEGRYLSAAARNTMVMILGLQHVPVMQCCWRLNENDTVESLLDLAESKSVLAKDKEREGIVFKCVEDPTVSFKAISNKFLLGHGG